MRFLPNQIRCPITPSAVLSWIGVQSNTKCRDPVAVVAMKCGCYGYSADFLNLWICIVFCCSFMAVENFVQLILQQFLFHMNIIIFLFGGEKIS